MAALLLGLPLDAARTVLAKLIDAHLMDPTGDGEFRFHPLISEYARELVPQAHSGVEPRVAVERVSDGGRCGGTCRPTSTTALAEPAGPSRPLTQSWQHPMGKVDAA